jgi:hypothetical protein
MLREAELFVMAEQMLVEVLGRIRDDDLGIVLPPMSAGADVPASLHHVVMQQARADAWVPDLLDGRSPHEPGRERYDDPLGCDRQATVARLADAACAAAGRVTDGAAVVHSLTGDVSTRDYLLRGTVERSLVAHYVAAYLGSTACPLPEELARPMWELTWPEAQSWRDRGIFREPMLPLPDHVSWRDRFLLCAGHPPHPLGH